MIKIDWNKTYNSQKLISEERNMFKCSVILIFLLGNISLGSELIGDNCEMPNKPGFEAILQECVSEFDIFDDIACYLPANDCHDPVCPGFCPKIDDQISMPCEIKYRCKWKMVKKISPTSDSMPIGSIFGIVFGVFFCLMMFPFGFYLKRRIGNSRHEILPTSHSPQLVTRVNSNNEFELQWI